MKSAFTEELPCELSDEERALKADELAREVKHHADVEQQKKKATADLAAQIKASDAAIAKLATMVRTGIEYREIGCTERLDAHNSKVEIFRMDTGMLVRSRPMNPDEKQAELFNAGYDIRPPSAGTSEH